MVKVKLQRKDGQFILVDDSQTWMAQGLFLDELDIFAMSNKKLQAALDKSKELRSDWLPVKNEEYGWGEVIATAHCTFTKSRI